MHGPIAHILLRKADWDSHPRRLRVDGPGGARVVRLSWFETLPAGLLIAIWADGRRIDLLTIPADIHHAAACTILEMAADVTNHFHTPDFLATLATPADRDCPPGTRTETESIWESEAGRPSGASPARALTPEKAAVGAAG